MFCFTLINHYLAYEREAIAAGLFQYFSIKTNAVTSVYSIIGEEACSFVSQFTSRR